MGNPTVLQCILIAVAAGIAMSVWVHLSVGALFYVSPLMIGFVIGVIMRNVPEAMMISAGLQLVYMGVAAPGSIMPTAPTIATAVAVPIALAGRLSPAQALAIAIPMGLLGTYLISLKFLVNSFTIHLADRFAEKLDDRGITYSALILPGILDMFVFAIPIFLVDYYGTPLISSLLALLPQSVLHALTITGAALPALGIAVLLMMITKGNLALLAFYILSYFVVVMLKPLNVNVLVYAIIVTIVAYLYVTLRYRNVVEEGNASPGVEGDNRKERDISKKSETTNDNDIALTGKDIRNVWFRWMFSTELGKSYERQSGGAFLWSVIPVLRKLYKNNSDELREAYKRHLTFFITEHSFGGSILGITVYLEEQRARALAKGEEASDPGIITSMKTGLMGPLAGIGDSLNVVTLRYLIIALAIPWAEVGSAMGFFFPLIVYPAIVLTYSFYLVRLGYKLGGQAMAALLGGAQLKAVITGFSILGIMVMGFLTSSYVLVSTPLKWTISGKLFELQPLLDKILPGILSLLAVMLVYLYFQKKGFAIQKALLGMVVILFVFGIIGVL